MLGHLNHVLNSNHLNQSMTLSLSRSLSLSPSLSSPFSLYLLPCLFLFFHSRSTILVVVKPQNHISYQPGDHIAIYPQNNVNLVKQLLERLPLTCSIDEPIVIESQYETDGNKY